MTGETMILHHVMFPKYQEDDKQSIVSECCFIRMVQASWSYMWRVHLILYDSIETSALQLGLQ